MPPAIRIEDIGKRYLVNHAEERAPYRTLRGSIVRAAAAPLRRLRSGAMRTEEFWALRDVGFDVQPGEVIGIIGRNGAGKSTLLKILTRITEPTTGQAELRGRVGSLLEVGTGFHPELSGRENIFMNGAVLGMSRKEIRHAFDEIVAFAEIEEFLDTPVKRYSSGMYVRLAFAVAAHLNPEILIVDEVLAVGDIAFQRKCLGRMRDVSQSGRTILFVSHNMAAVESLCEKAVLLNQGRVELVADVQDAICAYCRNTIGPESTNGASLAHLGGPHRKHRVFESATLLGESGKPISFLPLGGSFHLRIGLRVHGTLEHPTIGIGFDDSFGQRLLTVHTAASKSQILQICERCEVDCRIRNFPLAPGDYWLKLALTKNGAEIDTLEQALSLRVVNGNAFAEGHGFTRGVCVAPSEWRVSANGATQVKNRPA